MQQQIHKLANKEAINMILKRIRKEVNKIEGTDYIYIFVAFTKIKVLSN